MKNLKKMTNEELIDYWNVCENACRNEPYVSMNSYELEDTKMYLSIMCMQYEFTERGLILPI